MAEITIVDSKVTNGVKYAILFEEELLIGFHTKEDADNFETNMPKGNKYHRMADLKISIKVSH